MRQQFEFDWLESNTCNAHSFALVGNQSSHTTDPGQICLPQKQLDVSFLTRILATGEPVVVEGVAKLENIIGKVYNYLGRSPNR